MKAAEEFARLIRGEGAYTADLAGDAAFVAFVRSDVAHGRIVSLETAGALGIDGVHHVYTGADFAGLASFPANAFHPLVGDGGLIAAPRPAVARDRVRFVGEIIAVVVADSAAAAQDGAEAVWAEIEDLPVVQGLDEAAHQTDLHEGIARNLAMDTAMGDAKAVAAAMRNAAHTIEVRVDLPRVVPNAMEPRSALARFDPTTGQYYLSAPHQGAPEMQKPLAQVLGVDPGDVVIEDVDVGGAFGARGAPYPEQAALLAAARASGRTLFWPGTRGEGFLTEMQGRGNRLTGRLAVDDAGRFTAIDVVYEAELGAYATPVGALINLKNAAPCVTGAYAIDTAYLRVVQRYTNAAPTGPYRGAGRPDIALLVERLVERASVKTGRDPLELRRLNAARPEAMPWATPLGATYDACDFPALLEAASQAADWDGFAARAEIARKAGLLRGIGMALFVEVAGGGPLPEDQAMVTLLRTEDDTLAVEARILGHSTGQGLASAFCPMVARALGCPAEAVTLAYDNGQSGLVGAGAFASRSVTLTGAAVLAAVEQARRALISAGAEVLGVAPQDIWIEDGMLCTGDRREPLARLVRTATQGAGEMRFTGTVARTETFPNGAHVAEVEVDPATGATRVLRYTAVDDCGTPLNETLVHAQVHGGIVQGIGEALGERAVYDENGQLLSASFMDYQMPRAADIPVLDVHLRPVPSTTNPLGAKGVGEAGLTGALAATINAVHHALGPGPEVAMPLTPNRVWAALQMRG